MSRSKENVKMGILETGIIMLLVSIPVTLLVKFIAKEGN
jgi:hypothetical protein